MENFDVIIVGSGPAGEKAAAQAAYFGKKVLVVEKETVVGGAMADIYKYATYDGLGNLSGHKIKN
ncbi:MAG TPA: FAD-dependent oxidoreductase [Pyrinomonadaceae bacterium]|nr:FAD-dependent oxidoreductase [Pyrinomonadaceae bacterium]